MELLTVLIVLALLATVATLGMGVATMVRGGEVDREQGTRLMASRVGLQALTLAFLLAALYFA